MSAHFLYTALPDSFNENPTAGTSCGNDWACQSISKCLKVAPTRLLWPGSSNPGGTSLSVQSGAGIIYFSHDLAQWLTSGLCSILHFWDGRSLYSIRVRRTSLSRRNCVTRIQTEMDIRILKLSRNKNSDKRQVLRSALLTPNELLDDSFDYCLF